VSLLTTSSRSKGRWLQVAELWRRGAIGVKYGFLLYEYKSATLKGDGSSGGAETDDS
jgi:hypothetical protein